MKRGKIIFSLLSILILLTACGEKIGPGEQNIQRPVVRDVTIGKVTRERLVQYYETTGTLQAINTSIVSAKIMGEVKEIRAEAGTQVKKGEVLLVISSPDITARVQAARQAVEQARKAVDMAVEEMNLAEKTFARFTKLYQEQAISGQEYDEVRAKQRIASLHYEETQNGFGRAQASLKEAESFSSYSVIRSPVDGIVAERKIDRGSMAVPGAPLFVVAEAGYRIEAALDEDMVSSVKLQSPAEIFIGVPDLHVTGIVGEIDHLIDPATRTFTVRIDIREANGTLRPGAFARVKFPRGEEERLVIRRDALVRRGGLRGVYAVSSDGVISFRLLKTGKTTDDRIEVLSGLAEGDQIIVSGMDHAVDGGIVSN